MISIFSEIPRNPESPFILEEHGSLSYGQFEALSVEFSQGLVRAVGVVALGNSKEALIAYFGFLAAGVVPMFVNPASSPALSEVLRSYQPRYMVTTSAQKPEHYLEKHVFGGATLWEASNSEERYLNENLAFLQLTSGSTGSPKTVRISPANIQSVTYSIGRYMGFSSSRRIVGHLPFHYVYGISLVHLAYAYGASIFLTPVDFMDRKFWDLISDVGVTDFSGVPFHYETLARSGIPADALETLECATQAGGALSPNLVEHFFGLFGSHNTDFYVMYGQAEASPRISFMGPTIADAKKGSVGKAIDVGSLSIDTGGSGEILYSGPNVCLGYAHGHGDLTLGDEFKGILRTGDLGKLDSDGFLFIDGRAKRSIKVHGSSVALDWVESQVRELRGPAAVIGKTNRLLVIVDGLTDLSVSDIRGLVPTIHPSVLEVHRIAEIPLLPSGKIDYRSLEKEWL